MLIAIVGSREYPDLGEVEEYVRSLPRSATVVSGGAKGVDFAAVAEAGRLGMRTEVFPADWGRWGNSAGPRRNVEIVKYVDRVVAFWDGKSRGTKHTINTAIMEGVPVRVIRPRGEIQERRRKLLEEYLSLRDCPSCGSCSPGECLYE